ncbi:hypothetical protein SAMN03159341_104402 [Paenibacillus sp. 1_12]|nr:hypothetical protein SAMN03159341_104402 [Paenibacillus sp. 1_12]
MNQTLAVIAGLIGLLVTGSAVLMAWLTMNQLQDKRKHETSNGRLLDGTFRHLLRWTFFDYALIGVFTIGSMFLLADLLAVIRDAQSYPLYHYGYLVCGFVFMIFGMLFMVLRLSLVLSLVRMESVLSGPNQHEHPGKTEQPEERIQGSEERFKPKLTDYIGK